MTRPHSQISSMIKLYGQASASANKVDHERWQRKRDSIGGRMRRQAGGPDAPFYVVTPSPGCLSVCS